MIMSGVSDMGESIGFQALEPHRDGYRFLHATEGAGSRPSPIGDGSDAGHLAAVSSGRHAVVQPDGDGEQGQRLDLAPTSRAMSAHRSVGAGPHRAGRHGKKFHQPVTDADLHVALPKDFVDCSGRAGMAPGLLQKATDF